MRAAVGVLLVLLLLPGCSRPLSSNAMPDRPSVPHSAADEGPTMSTNGSIWVSSLPELLLARAPQQVRDAALQGRPLNCIEVVPGDGHPLFVAELSIELSWTPGSSQATVLLLTYANNTDFAQTVAGPSPLWINVTGNDTVAPLLPVQIEVRPLFGSPVVLQEARLEVGARTYKPRDISLRQAECVTRMPGALP